MYDQAALEKKWQDHWDERKIYRYDPESPRPVYSIDNPPRYASGSLHAGHAVHYTHIDFAARFRRMTGYNVIFPLCFDVNGIPIEERVERLHGVSPREIGRQKFNELCGEFADRNIREMTRQFRILGESMDDTYSYQTNAPHYRRLTQISFIKLYHRGLMYRGEFPINWCPRCHTALADAEVEYGNRTTKLNYIRFRSAHHPEESVLVATTRPELLPTCQIVAVHPDDPARSHLVGRKVLTPLFDREVEVIADDKVDPAFGTGVVMICTIGDKDDLEWVYRYKLPVEKGIDEEGKLTAMAGKYAGMTAAAGREAMLRDMEREGLLVKQEETDQSVGGCWRCKTPLEYIVKEQWFLRTLPFKEQVWEAANRMDWYPEFMKIRLREWIDSLEWDWVVSRQRFFATPIPIWECRGCREIVPATEEQCYIDPTIDPPPVDTCPACGSRDLAGCEDVFDTWMDSSLSPLFLARWQQEDAYPGHFGKLFPITLRPQAHDIIRTWAFYTILRSVLLTEREPFREIMMDGFILSEDGTPMHTSLGNVIDPLKVLEEYGADALRYFAASCSLGMDNAFRFKDIKRGQRLLRKLWNVGMFIGNALERSGIDMDTIRGRTVAEMAPDLTVADRWILSRYSTVVRNAREHMGVFQFDRAMRDIENFMWHELADNYIEMVKQRIYTRREPGAAFTLYTVGYGLIRALAPFLPHITEEMFHIHYRAREGGETIHFKDFPEPVLEDPGAEETGSLLRDIIVAVRSWKSGAGLPLNTEIASMELVGVGMGKCMGPGTGTETAIGTGTETATGTGAETGTVTGSATATGTGAGAGDTGSSGAGEALRRVAAEGRTLQDALSIRELAFADTTDLHEEVMWVKPVHARVGPAFRVRAREVVEFIGRADPADLAGRLEAGEEVKVPLRDGEEVTLAPEFVEIRKALVAHGKEVDTLRIGEMVAILRR